MIKFLSHTYSIWKRKRSYRANIKKTSDQSKKHRNLTPLSRYR